jgi:hypothetical protein
VRYTALLRWSFAVLLLAALVWFGHEPYGHPSPSALLNEVTK